MSNYAFPGTHTASFSKTGNSHEVSHPGMTLRDYFAGQFVAGYSRKWEKISDSSFDEIAEQAYTLADAMLKERESSG